MLPRATHRQSDEAEEEQPVTNAEREDEDIRHWDACVNKPRKVVSGSEDESIYITYGIKLLKVLTVIFTFCVVLGSAVVSKGTLLFMISQLTKNITRSYCNKNLDVNKQFVVTLPEEERVVWIWILMFAYMVPELGTFIRSVRIMCFKTWTCPALGDFFWPFISESLVAVGSALLVFIVLPELDVIKGAMLTNAICFIPGLVAFISRIPYPLMNTMEMILDVVAITAQASAFVVWPLIEGRPILYVIPVSVLFISFGWWENFVSKESRMEFFQTRIDKQEKEKNDQKLKNGTYFIYSIIAPWKCLVFFGVTVVIIILREGDALFLFNRFLDAFRSHNINITEIIPNINVTEAVATGYYTTRETSLWTPLSVWFINIASTFICYAFGKFACKIKIQAFSFALPINLAVPVLLTALIAMCGQYNQDVCAFQDVIPPYLFFTTPSLSYLNDFIARQYSWIWLLWLLSQSWISRHIWTNNNEKLASTEDLYFKPMYDAYLIDQSVALNRRIIEKKKSSTGEHRSKHSITRIYACGTMWHESREEMEEFVKSILRMDQDQCSHSIMKRVLGYDDNYYEFETHIFFDDALEHTEAGIEQPNQYVYMLIESVQRAVLELHGPNIRLQPPELCSTPYGARILWTLPGKTEMCAHLKDNTKVRAKKRWSQVMYMYYLLGYGIGENKDIRDRVSLNQRGENTYILALDGDVDFQPEAVHLLVERMKKCKKVGAACGRIHPVGSGAMVYYQCFEYAAGHWLQKSTEHVIGCVLCSPGCFSLFRAKALLDVNVMAKYTTISERPLHSIQYDQGEDRWLCTLLLQRGYRVEYCSASDAYTRCPEGFNEFYNQRRRWMPSTTANILDLLTDYKHVVEENDNISILYILYQAALMIGTVIGPGTIFLMLVGAFVAAFKLGQWGSFAFNIIPILLFVLICATCKSDTQLFFAGVISCVYGVIMMAVLVAVIIQIQDDGWLAPSSLFFFSIALVFIITALLHPQEIYCLKYGIIYYVTVPSMYLLLVIYSVFNMNNISWGTRDVPTTSKEQPKNEDKKEEEKPEQTEGKKHKTYSFFGNKKDNAGSFEFSCAGLCKIICCTHQANGEEYQMLKSIQESLLQQQQKLNLLEQNQFVDGLSESSQTTIKKTITIIEGPQARIADAEVKIGSNQNEIYGSNSILSDGVGDSILSRHSDETKEWFYDPKAGGGPVYFLDRNENTFWIQCLAKYLTPIVTTDKAKAKIDKELKDLRDKVVITFLMINALFVTVVFLLTLQKDRIHINWPLDPKINFTYYTDQNKIYINKTYLELEPIGFVFLICFAAIMVIQFLAMLYHRFITYSHIMANTTVHLFERNDIRDLTLKKTVESKQRNQKYLVKFFKTLTTPQGINNEDEEMEKPVIHRNTLRDLRVNKQTVVKDLEDAYDFHLKKWKDLLDDIRAEDDKNLPLPRRTLHEIIRKDSIDKRRKTQALNNNHSKIILPDNLAQESETE